MAGERKITVTFDGKDVGLGDAVKGIERDMAGAERKARDLSGGFDSAGEHSDEMERRARGLSDTIGGTQDTLAGWSSLMKGDVSGGLMQMGMGVADLAGGMSDLIIPLGKQVATWVSGHAAMAGATIASAASQVGAWIMLGLSSLAAAAQVAIAWLISIGPIILVAAAVIGLVVLIVKNWDTIKRVTVEVFRAVADAVRSGIDTAVGFVRGIPGAVTGALSGLASVFLAPWRLAFEGIRTLWNSTIGGKGFSIPSWVPGIGGKGFTIPRLHTGGVFRTSQPGGEGLALLQDGERVLSRRDTDGGGVVHVQVIMDSKVLIDAIRKGVANRGGVVQAVLGT